MTAGNHLDAEKIQAYFSGALSEYQEGLVEEHLGVCDVCARAANQVTEFSSMWDVWTAEAHGEAAKAEAYAADPLASALQRARSLFAEWDARLADWLAGAQAWWNLPGIEIAWTSAEAIPVQSAGAAAPVRVLLRPARPRARVNLEGAQRSVAVAVAAADLRQPALVLLTPATAGAEPRVRILVYSAAGAWEAVFDGLSEGRYLLALEPVR